LGNESKGYEEIGKGEEMCGEKMKDRKRTAEFLDCLGVMNVEEVVSHG